MCGEEISSILFQILVKTEFFKKLKFLRVLCFKINPFKLLSLKNRHSCLIVAFFSFNEKSEKRVLIHLMRD